MPTVPEADLEQRRAKEFEKLLIERKLAILGEAERAVGGMSQREALSDPTDRALLESNRNAMLRMRDRERKLLAKIDEALQRIAENTYGRCELCAKAIGTARLRARPVTTLCIECKSLQEADEQRKRRLGYR